jgi:putative membrane protein
MMAGPIWMLLWWTLIIGLVIAAAVFVWRAAQERRGPRRSGDALDILDERFSRGEIDREEYEERRGNLTR